MAFIDRVIRNVEKNDHGSDNRQHAGRAGALDHMADVISQKPK